MNSNPELIESITFVTSPEGHRFERTQLRAFAVATALGAFCWNGYPATGAALAEIVFQTAIFVVPVLLLSYTYNASEWDSTFRIDGDYVHLVRCTRNRKVPLSELRWIRVKSSRDGSHRLVTVRAPYFAFYRVRDPEHGDALETWVKEAAPERGVDVQIRQSWFLALGRWGIWITYCGSGMLAGLLASVLYPP